MFGSMFHVCTPQRYLTPALVLAVMVSPILSPAVIDLFTYHVTVLGSSVLFDKKRRISGEVTLA